MTASIVYVSESRLSRAEPRRENQRRQNKQSRATKGGRSNESAQHRLRADGQKLRAGGRLRQVGWGLPVTGEQAMAGWYQRRPDRAGVFLQTTPGARTAGRGKQTEQRGGLGRRTGSSDSRLTRAIVLSQWRGTEEVSGQYSLITARGYKCGLCPGASTVDAECSLRSTRSRLQSKRCFSPVPVKGVGGEKKNKEIIVARDAVCSPPGRSIFTQGPG